MAVVQGTRGQLAAGLVVLALALVGCTTGSSPGLSTAGPSASPSLAASPSPTRSPSPDPVTATDIDPTLVLRTDAVPDVTAGRIPGLSVYADGTVLLRGDAGLVARLTPEALDGLWSELLADPAVSGDDIAPPPDYAAGFVTYIVQVRDLDRLVSRKVTNPHAPEQAAEATAVMALVDRLLALDEWLPDEAWVVAPDDATAWVPATYLLKVTDWGYPGDVTAPVDLADVSWPLPGLPTDFGDPLDIDVAPDDAGAPRVVRCGVLDLDEALAVQHGLLPAFADTDPGIPWHESAAADLTWLDRGSHVTITLRAQLPDDPADCSADTSWP